MAVAVRYLKNNRATLQQALGEGVQWIKVKGDSTLTIGMASGGYKPGKPYFWHLVKEIKYIIKGLPWRIMWE